MKDSLKIAIFHCGFAYSGGGERLVLEEVLGLRRLGHDVICYAPTLDKDQCFPDIISDIGVKTFLPQLPRWVPGRNWLSMAICSALAPILALKFPSIDVFVGANQPGAWIAFVIARILRRPFVIYLNQPNRIIYPRQIDLDTGWSIYQPHGLLSLIVLPLKRFVGWADNLSIRSANMSLANGGYIAGVIKETYGRDMEFCPAGCHPQPWRLLHISPKSAYEGALKFGTVIVEKPFVLITNRHVPQKKFEYVIEALSKIGTDVPAATLVIPGPFTPHTPNLISFAEELGIRERVQFLGQVSETDLQRLYREAAVYCYPAPEEDFGMGVIEAMAWGLPVVAWNSGGPTVTVLDGETGFLAEPHNIQAYADAIYWLLRDPILRNRMGSAGHERVVRYFSWDRHVRVLERALRYANGEAIDVKVPVGIPANQYAGAGPLRMSRATSESVEIGTGPLIKT